MDDFSIKPGAANIYGVVGGATNEIQPSKRMLSSMSPTLVLKGKQLEMVVGTPGGSTIFTSVFQAIANVIDFQMSAEQAVSVSRFHHQLLPPTLITHSVSAALIDSVKLELSQLGYTVEPHGWEFGDLQIIVRNNDGKLTAASDPRGVGVSKVFD
jgi:gamma-glutamyltranspeptidase/glutathione hydrolase